MTTENTIRALTALSAIDRELVEGAARTGAKRARLEERREALRKSIPPSPLESYDALGRTGRRPAVVELRNAHCGGCFLRLPPQIHSRIRRESLSTCPHCRRLLYWPASGDGNGNGKGNGKAEPAPSRPAASPAPKISKTASRRTGRAALLTQADRRREPPARSRRAGGRAASARKSSGASGKRRLLYQS
jgi:hypothetical protein